MNYKILFLAYIYLVNDIYNLIYFISTNCIIY
jgi:hypothetical protein